MIRPRIRASLSWDTVIAVSDDLDRVAPHIGRLFRVTCENGRIDDALLDPDALEALLGATALPQLRMPLHIQFLMVVNRALLDVGIHDIELGDYLATLLLSYGGVAGACGIGSDTSMRSPYLAELLCAAERLPPESAHSARIHIAETSLWLSGVLRSWVASREKRYGGPGVLFYEGICSATFRSLSASERAERDTMARLFALIAQHTRAIRVALNEVSDQHLFPPTGPTTRTATLSVDRLLQRMIDLTDIGHHAS